MPSSLQLNGGLFSSYKNHTTLKGLVGISPGGAITFISQLLPLDLCLIEKSSGEVAF